MEMGEVFKTAGFRRARGRARGSCGDADRDDARRAVEGVADGLVSQSDKHARSDLQPVRRQPEALAAAEADGDRRRAWRPLAAWRASRTLFAPSFDEAAARRGVRTNPTPSSHRSRRRR